jgi:hypothetical protein
MSKLGIHISSGNRQGFSDFLAKCHAAGGGPTPPPSTTIEPLDFEVRLIDNRKDPDRPKGIIPPSRSK